MNEIDETFGELLRYVETYKDFQSRIIKLESLVWRTFRNLRKENFELYKALHGVKHPEDIEL